MKNIIKSGRYFKCDSYVSHPFPTEAALVASFSSLLEASNKKFYFSHEFNCGFGIADIVIFKKTDLNESINLGKISSDWAFTLKCLPLKKKFSIENIIGLSGSSSSSARKAIKEFINAGFCIQIENNAYIKLKNPKPVCNSIIAIEAKLKDWKRALWQASRYKIFSTQSWVVLDKHTANPAISNLKEFKKYNIGLATFTADGFYEEIYTPLPEDYKSELAFWKANSLIAKELLDRNSF